MQPGRFSHRHRLGFFIGVTGDKAVISATIVAIRNANRTFGAHTKSAASTINGMPLATNLSCKGLITTL